MCGILVSTKNISKNISEQSNHLLINRGPDNLKIENKENINFLHTLLSMTGEFTEQPIVKNNIVTFSNSLGDITAIDANNGSLIWQKFTQNSEIYEDIMTLKMSSLISNNESIYFSNNKNQFYSIDFNTGITNWTQQINSNVKPAIIGNFIFTISLEGYFFIIEKNTGNILRITNIFDKLKKKKNEKIFPTGFIFNFQNLFISTNNGRLLIVDIKTGKIKNVLKIDSNIISRPVVQSQNMYVIKNNSIIKLN